LYYQDNDLNTLVSGVPSMMAVTAGIQLLV
jgi:hypothetical protein